MVGKIKWFNNHKGYGFITSSDNKDYFVHYSGILGEGFKSLEKDAEVTFDAGVNSNGICAVNVRVCN